MRKTTKNITVRLEPSLWQRARRALFTKEETFQRFCVGAIEKLVEGE